MTYALPRVTPRAPVGPGAAHPASLALTAWPGMPWLADALHMPFDVMRGQHAQAVRAGLMANSILESQRFEQRIDALERLWLGPFAREV